MGLWNLVRYGQWSPQFVKDDTWWEDGDRRWIGSLYSRSTLVKGGTPLSPHVEQPLTIGTVYRGVNVLANSIAMLPIEVKRELEDGSFEPVRNHPLRRLFRQPNPYQTGFQFMQMLMGHLVLRGNAYCRIVSRGKWAEELMPLHPDRVSPWDITDEGVVLQYRPPRGPLEYLTTGKDALHFRAFSDDGFVGLSVFDLMRRHTAMVTNMEEYGLRFFSRAPSLKGIITAPFRMKKETAMEYQDQWRKETSGPNNWFSTRVLDRGMDWKSVGVTNEQSQWIESRQFSVPEFCRYLGVPAVLVMHTDRTSLYANAARFFSAFAQFDLAQWYTSLEQTFTTGLLVSRELERNIRVDIQEDQLLRGNAIDRAKYYETMIRAGVMDTEEARRMERLPKRDKPPEPQQQQQSTPAEEGSREGEERDDAENQSTP